VDHGIYFPDPPTKQEQQEWESQRQLAKENEALRTRLIELEANFKASEAVFQSGYWQDRALKAEDRIAELEGALKEVVGCADGKAGFDLPMQFALDHATQALHGGKEQVPLPLELDESRSKKPLCERCGFCEPEYCDRAYVVGEEAEAEKCLGYNGGKEDEK
jgi:hypothetical protein